MKETRILMGMPVTLEVVDGSNEQQKTAIGKVYDYFNYIDQKFSTYKDTSEITKINKGLIQPADYSEDMKTVFVLSEKTKTETGGYFDISTGRDKHGRTQYDPSGMVKGWAIFHATKLLEEMGFAHFYVDAGGDMEVRGKNSEGKTWTVGIRDPFDKTQQNIVKTLFLRNNEGVATSGTYIRGQHIYDPNKRAEHITDIVSLTVIGPNIYEADRFATACFAMGKKGIEFVEQQPGIEGYMIDSQGIATMTSGFEQYTKE